MPVRAVLFLSLVLWSNSVSTDTISETILDTDGCVSYEDTPICYRPVDPQTPITFALWEVKQIYTDIFKTDTGESYQNCVVIFQSILDTSTLAATADRTTLAQQIYFANRWQRWMDFDLSVSENCLSWPPLATTSQ